MNANTKKWNRLLWMLLAAAVVSLITMLFVLCQPGKQKVVFTPPPFDPAAIEGTPTVPDELDYGELFQEDMAYRFSICGRLTREGDQAIVYFTNTASNEAWLKLRVCDAAGRILGESGLIKPGEYIKAVALDTIPNPGDKILIKIMGYEPDTYYSAGSVNLNTFIAN